MINNADILIIGAGAAGLMAARILSGAGKQVTILEARNRCGGRIHTLNPQPFSEITELGAEFVHGDLPVTLGLLNEAGIPYHSASGEMLHYKNGKFSKEGEFKGWDQVVQRLGKLDADLSINDFLQKEFPGEDQAGLRTAVTRFVSGYDTADPDKASSFALREERQNEDEGAQHRIDGGYGLLIKYLEDECKSNGAHIYLNSIVKEITWKPGEVTIIADDGTIYEAGKVIIAVPLGILQAAKDLPGAISFTPEITEYSDAINKMGFGSIVKILLEFDAPFWEDDAAGASAGISLKDMGFVLSEEEIPTWWTQAPRHSPVLTGWLGGLPAAKKVNATSDQLLEQSLQSLSHIFKRGAGELKEKLVAFNVINWTSEPFTRGSYAYDTVAAREARNVLSNPIENTIFFAGEYLYEGPAMGTVEAALTSGKVAEKLID